MEEVKEDIMINFSQEDIEEDLDQDYMSIEKIENIFLEEEVVIKDRMGRDQSTIIEL